MHDICITAAEYTADFTHVNSVQVTQGQRAAKLRNITPIHGSQSAPPSVKVSTPTALDAIRLMQFAYGIILIVSERTCRPEMPGLFSLQIYFCLTVSSEGVILFSPDYRAAVRLALDNVDFAMIRCAAADGIAGHCRLRNRLSN